MNATEKKALKRTLVGTVVSDKMDKMYLELIGKDNELDRRLLRVEAKVHF